MRPWHQCKFRHWLGVIRYWSRNCRLKEDRVLYPASCAMVDMERSDDSNNTAAIFRRIFAR